jgi:isoleucyl-tRNA synthetase
MFKPIGSHVSFPKMEECILGLWKDIDVFKKTVSNREGKDRFVFYEGPPFANGNPGIHHVLARAYKDIIIRYKVMKGYHVPRIAGWDTHGLPVELEVEKQLGITNKDQIEKIGIEEFNKRCRESVFKYVKEWNSMTERIAYWVDLEHAYVTMNNTYIESVWWALKQLWDKDLVYQGYRVTPHCPRCGTSLSSHEVAQGYKDNTVDPSVYIKFKVVVDTSKQLPVDKPVYLLAWTTTPWTLPGNTALAVSPDAEYTVLRGTDDYLVLAGRLAAVLNIEGYTQVKTIIGKNLVGVRYQPLYSPHEFSVDRLMFQEDGSLEQQSPESDLSYAVISGDFVTMDDGTGIVHVAPAFGEVDYEAGKSCKLSFVQQVDLQGKLTGSYPFAGKFVKAADPLIMNDLKERGLLFRSGTVSHTYPFCWRCDAPLLYYAKQTWYIKTTAVKDAMIALNQQINWYPEHIKNGRFGNWLENNVDWAFARERYWGAPLPIWYCEKCKAMECVGSIAELKGKPGFSGLKEPLDLHRPYVDDVSFNCAKCGGKMKRTPEVMDCWFESGSMPFAQFHYPLENKELFDNSMSPAEFISEGVDQTRGWFYSLHAISTMLFNRPAFKNCICLELVLDAKGKKMSKSRGNIVWPKDVIDKEGADALRWYLYTGSPPGTPRQFDTKQVGEASRRVLSTLWNVYSFFVMYANIDNYKPTSGAFPKPEAELDKWILSELNQLIVDVDKSMENYDPTGAGRKLEIFVDYLSNWYVRRSRRRFWKSENDTDKINAYNTLYHCLITLIKLMAPFTPFLTEEIYQNLVRSAFPEALESVHLADFPVADITMIDKQLADDNRLAMKICSLGRSARAKAGIKIRQPLEKIYAGVTSDWETRAAERMASLILEELNIKELLTEKLNHIAGMEVQERWVVVSEGNNAVAVFTGITMELEAEGMAREIAHRVQSMRKTAGLEITDHILFYYEGSANFVQSISAFSDYIRQEILADDIDDVVPESVDLREETMINGYSLVLGIKKVK